MGNRYTVTRTVTPTADQDIFTLTSASNRRIRIVALAVVGLGTTSAAQKLLISNSTGGTTPGGGITPGKGEHVDQPAASFTAPTTWSAQPSLAGQGETVGWNALGGINRWVTPPGRPQGMFEARNGEHISIRAQTGVTYQSAQVTATVEED
jgi:hypothetical protein